MLPFGNLTVTLLNGINNQPIAHEEIYVQRLQGGGFSTIATGFTDVRGLAGFRIDELGGGSTFRVRVRPYNGSWIDSPSFTNPREVVLRVGKVPVTVSAGDGSGPMANTPVQLRKLLPDGSKAYLTTGLTDASGQIIFDPPSLGAGDTFVVMTQSPHDGSWKTSAPITSKGPVSFSVGNAPLIVSVSNGLNGTKLKGIEVSALKVLPDGSLRWTADQTTDNDGKATFDLEGLGDETAYVLQVEPYNGGPVQTLPITDAGPYQFQVGRLPVTLVAGDGSGPLTGIRVELRSIATDGSTAFIKAGDTNAAGRIIFDDAGLGNSTRYILRARSPHDGTWKQSAEIAAAGALTFTVGNAPLTVSVVNGLTGLPLAGLDVVASSVQPDGSFEWVTKRDSTVDGAAVFDLDGLGTGTRFIVHVEPFNGGRVYSTEITSPGNITLSVGELPITLLAGENSLPMPNYPVQLHQLQPDGTTRFTKGGTTDASGRIIFDVPDLGTGTKYVVRAQSQHDGTWKQSPPITEKGPVNFTVGAPPLHVTLINGLSGTPIAAEEIVAMRVAADGSKTRVTSGFTDASGRVTFDLDGLGSGSEYLLRSTPYNGGFVHSPTIDGAGEFTFSVGELPVNFVNGDGSGVITDLEAELMEILSDGSQVFVKKGITDASGSIVFDAPGLSGGRSYVVRAQSPHDESWKQTPPITTKGAITFTVGNAPLTVELVNYFSGNPLSNQKIFAMKQDGAGSESWSATQTTNNNGLAVFDLEGLGTGTSYKLRTEPYNGGMAYTAELDETGYLRFEVGSVPVRLVDASTGQPLVGRELQAYEKFPDGTLLWRKNGFTNALGHVNFDLEEVSPGRVYVIRSLNPFGGGNSYFSQPVISRGPVTFSVDPLDNAPLDQTLPTLSLRGPANGTPVANTGFRIDGFVSDDNTVMSVRIAVQDTAKGHSIFDAALSSGSGYWSTWIPQTAITAGSTVAIDIIAADDSYNEARLSFGYPVTTDTQKPSITIQSHSNGDTVLNSGFVVSGSTSDNTATTSLRATLIDSNLGMTMNSYEVPIANDGSWDLVVRDAEVSENASLTLTLTARDSSANQQTRTLNLHSLDSSLNAEKLLTRATFGPAPDLLAEIQASGPVAYLQQQLSPETIDDSDLQLRLDDAGLDPDSGRDFTREQIIRSLYSKRQLLEIMTWFWENHFNTDMNSSGPVARERAENAGFRTHALGYFRDLLQVSATSPAMMIYLDNHRSHKDNPNENYARELLELHTMGIDGGYTQQDVEEVARVFTGWKITDNDFEFKSWAHDYGSKTVLGHSIAPTGYAEGEQVLDILAEHPSTADFICTKLLQKFVADSPSGQSINDCATVFSNSDGHIASVLEHIFMSPAFNADAAETLKVTTPYEFVVGSLRAMQASEGMNDHQYAIHQMGMPLFRNPVPTGWPETSDNWTDSNQLLQRQQYAAKLAYRAPNVMESYLDPVAYFTARGVSTAEGIVGYLFMLTLNNDYSELEWDTALGVLTQDGTTPFDTGSPDAEDRIRQLLALVMSYPGYQLQ